MGAARRSAIAIRQRETRLRRRPPPAGITHEDDRWRLFAPFGTAWAGGAIGPHWRTARRLEAAGQRLVGRESARPGTRRSLLMHEQGWDLGARPSGARVARQFVTAPWRTTIDDPAFSGNGPTRRRAALTLTRPLPASARSTLQRRAGRPGVPRGADGERDSRGTTD